MNDDVLDLLSSITPEQLDSLSKMELAVLTKKVTDAIEFQERATVALKRLQAEFRKRLLN